MNAPLVSIIIPCYNAAPWVGATIESALAQTWRATEIIVIDDGSTDNSCTLANRFAPRGVRTFTQANRGASAARNHGLRVARGEFIQFLDADDLLSPDKIEAQVELLHVRPPGAVASCAWGRFTGDPAGARFVDSTVFRDFEPLEFLLLAAGTENSMMHPAAWLCPRKVLDAVGPWDETLSLNDDGEYFCRVLLGAAGIAFSSKGKSYYRSAVPGSLSRRRSNEALKSQFRSLQLVSEHLFSREQSQRVRQALANQWQRFIYDFYPMPSDLVREAERFVANFGGSRLRPTMGPRTACLARILGWRAVYRLLRFLRDER
jgi:glycosyltransferase involved in cell wall biosynthesis